MDYSDYFTAAPAPAKAQQQKVDPDKQLVGNIKTQLALFKGGTPKNRKGTPIEPTWELTNNGNSVNFALKYANVALPWPDGETWHTVARDNFEEGMQFLIGRVETGDFDGAINKVRKDRGWELFVRKDGK